MAQKSPSSRPSRVSIFHTESKAATRNRQRPTVLRGTGRQRLSVVIPTRNEAGNVAVLQQRLAEALSGIDREIIIVDDSNDDVSRPALATAAASDPTWRVIERSKREQTGLGSAVVEGLRMARGDAVCVMDGDLQHPPELIPRLLEQVEQGADMAVASRYMPGGSRAGLGGFQPGCRESCRHRGGQIVLPRSPHDLRSAHGLLLLPPLGDGRPGIPPVGLQGFARGVGLRPQPQSR